jgi:hypothetical protein
VVDQQGKGKPPPHEGNRFNRPAATFKPVCLFGSIYPFTVVVVAFDWITKKKTKQKEGLLLDQIKKGNYLLLHG